MRGSSQSPVPSSWIFLVLTPSATSACTTSGTASPPSGMNSASARTAAWATAFTGSRHGGLVVRIVLERDNLAAAARDVLLERRFDDRAVGIVRHQGGERALSGRGRILHDARDVRFRQKAQQIDAGRSDIGVGRKGDDRHVARPRHLPDDADRLRKQRSEDDLGSLVERLLCGEPRRLGGTAVILHQKLDVGRIEFGERHFRRVAHRLAGNAGIAAGRQRQDESNLDLAGSNRRRRAALPCSAAAGARYEGGISLEDWNCRNSRQERQPAWPASRQASGAATACRRTPEPAIPRPRRFSSRQP